MTQEIGYENDMKNKQERTGCHNPSCGTQLSTSSMKICISEKLCTASWVRKPHVFLPYSRPPYFLSSPFWQMSELSSFPTGFLKSPISASTLDSTGNAESWDVFHIVSWGYPCALDIGVAPLVLGCWESIPETHTMPPLESENVVSSRPGWKCH